ncbi:MAG: hypothetical protein ABIJ56_08700 [Pseudomonadota bacterium]
MQLRRLIVLVCALVAAGCGLNTKGELVSRDAPAEPDGFDWFEWDFFPDFPDIQDMDVEETDQECERDSDCSDMNACNGVEFCDPTTHRCCTPSACLRPAYVRHWNTPLRKA